MLFQTQRLVDEGDLTSTHISTSHPGGSDVGMLERHLESLKNDRLTPSALAYYGRHIEASDETHLVAWIEAVLRYARRDLSVLKEIRVRPSIETSKNDLLRSVFDQVIAAEKTDDEPPSLTKITGCVRDGVSPIHEGFVRGFREEIEPKILKDPLGILLQKFKDHPQLWPVLESRIPLHQRRMLKLLIELDAVTL